MAAFDAVQNGARRPGHRLAAPVEDVRGAERRGRPQDACGRVPAAPGVRSPGVGVEGIAPVPLRLHVAQGPLPRRRGRPRGVRLLLRGASDPPEGVARGPAVRREEAARPVRQEAYRQAQGAERRDHRVDPAPPRDDVPVAARVQHPAAVVAPRQRLLGRRREAAARRLGSGCLGLHVEPRRPSVHRVGRRQRDAHRRAALRAARGAARVREAALVAAHPRRLGPQRGAVDAVVGPGGAVGVKR
mmetsp:Transcript_28684/g.88880  ORF Transcript_28684/g.88880 Transcript_28684/m.88880 type:complete len:244 (+) Transcript_28684:199-930(+)